MKTEDLDYQLPAELIAQQPSPGRSDCRLLVLDRGAGTLIDSHFSNIANFLTPGDCLVLNDTKVLQARFISTRASGGRINGLYLQQRPDGLWQAMLRPSRRIRPGELIWLIGPDKRPWLRARIVSRCEDGTWLIDVQTDDTAEQVLEQIGLPPLPPYIKRDQDPDKLQIDRRYYQTVYARNPGAVAAPTAGLHFTEGLLGELAAKGIGIAYVTVHVGPGSFRPVATEELEDHRTVAEQIQIMPSAAELINRTRASGRRIVAVGTTSVRAIETAAVESGQRWVLQPYQGQTDLYIIPGFRFRLTDAMVTNFHLPRSTLLALVAAFAGLERIMAAYQHAIRQRYRFYSYGDAMLIL